jgi:hypothetical protein
MVERQGKSEQNYTTAARAIGYAALGMLMIALYLILF